MCFSRGQQVRLSVVTSIEQCPLYIIGTGKSVLLREIIKRLREKGKIVEVTASTGIAAVNVGGKTLHAFAGQSDPVLSRIFLIS